MVVPAVLLSAKTVDGTPVAHAGRLTDTAGPDKLTLLAAALPDLKGPGLAPITGLVNTQRARLADWAPTRLDRARTRLGRTRPGCTWIGVTTLATDTTPMHRPGQYALSLLGAATTIEELDDLEGPDRSGGYLLVRAPSRGASYWRRTTSPRVTLLDASGEQFTSETMLAALAIEPALHWETSHDLLLGVRAALTS